jgi:hypothetical protein
MAPISGQHASGTAAERRAIERLRTVGHLPQRRAGRIPRAPAEPPGFVAGLRADGRALGHVRLEPERRAEVLAGVDAAPLPAQGRAVREFGARALESAVPRAHARRVPPGTSNRLPWPRAHGASDAAAKAISSSSHRCASGRPERAAASIRSSDAHRGGGSGRAGRTPRAGRRPTRPAGLGGWRPGCNHPCSPGAWSGSWRPEPMMDI